MPATYEPIATTTLSSTATSITFNNIPGTYTDLRLVFIPIGSASMNVDMRFNNDSTTLYSNTVIYGDGSAANSSRAVSQSRIRLTDYVNVSSTPTLHIIDIFSYAGSTNKTCLIEQSMDNNGSGIVARYVGLYRSTSAITRIDLLNLVSTNFAVGTTATLYGILKA